MTNRREFISACGALAATLPGARRQAPAARPRPTEAQLKWQQDELAMFVHFGVNTFTDREWGEGTEDPSIFNPTALDCRQWARAARAAGFKSMILTAKHHDGFCLWPTATTRHSVASSPWKGGAGDVVREFTDACRAEQLGAGLYLSPWDRNAESYGSGDRYNAFYREQLTELLTRYGPLVEVWFDGANGEGPNGRRQAYDWPATWATVRRLQPHAVMFSDAGPDVRWIGNENGSAGDPNWSTVDPAIVTYPGASGPGVTEALQHGSPAGTVWRPGETDVSIRPGWFNHPAEDAHVRTPDDLVDLYFSSVGRNSKLLLNVPPTRQGLLNDRDSAALRGMDARLGGLFIENLAGDQRIAFTSTGTRSAIQEIALDRTDAISTLRLAERIERGQRVAHYTVDGRDEAGNWTALAHGDTIGYCKLERLASAPRLTAIRVAFETLDTPIPLGVRACPDHGEAIR